MYPQCRNEASVQATLTFLRTELLDDIRQYAYVEADIMDADDEHSRHQVFDIAEDGNIDRVTRVLNLAYSECVEALYPYSKTAVESTEERNDVLVQKLEYVIQLLLPETFSKTTVNILTEYIHEYMICRVLSDWFSITKPDSKKNWEEKAEKAISKMRSAIQFRTKRVRRTLSPF